MVSEVCEQICCLRKTWWTLILLSANVLCLDCKAYNMLLICVLIVLLQSDLVYDVE